jgi:hypothetical protein
MIKTRRVGWFNKLVCIGKVKNVHTIFVGKHEGINSLVAPGVGTT